MRRRLACFATALCGSAAYTPTHQVSPLSHALGHVEAASCVAMTGQTTVDTNWCVSSCGATPPNCPPELCTCTTNLNDEEDQAGGQSNATQQADDTNLKDWWIKLRNSKKAHPADGKANGTTGETAGQSALPPGADPSGCIAVDNGGMNDEWCRTQCGFSPPNCPPDLCSCADGGILSYDSDQGLPTTKTGQQDTEPKKTPEQQAAAEAAASAQAAHDKAAKAAEDAAKKASADANAAGSSAAASATASTSALPEGGDPNGCIADPSGSMADDWCRTQCSFSPPNCPINLCICSDDNGILVYGEGDDTPIVKRFNVQPAARSGKEKQQEQSHGSRDSDAERRRSGSAKETPKKVRSAFQSR